MVSSRRFLSLNYNVETDTWDLRDDRSNRLIKSFLTKEAATRRGVLEKFVGREGGSVVIRKKGGVYEEQRNYPSRV